MSEHACAGARIRRTVAAMLLTLSAASCSSNAPAKVSGCVIQSVAAPGGFVLIRRWAVQNIGTRAIDAIRIGMSSWPDEEIAESSPGGAVWDDEVPLSAGKAHVVVEPPTDPIAQRLFREPTPFHCKLVAVRYTDGSMWFARPGFAGPMPRHDQKDIR